MACSAVALSVATVSAVVALTCTAIAFGTDNWYEVRVNPDGNERLASLQEFESDLRYYSRDEGIFRICFPDKRPKGAVALFMSTVSAVAGLTCTAFAFGTDNWYEVRVNPDGNKRLVNLQEFESDPRYYSRDEGIFRICFTDKIPKGVRTYMSPVQTQCINIDYYINDNGISDTFTDQRWMRLHMARSVVALFIVSFLFSTLSAFPGLVGCWRRSHSNIIATGLLQLLAGLVVASAIALWHAIPHYEYEKLNFPEMSFSRWPENYLQQATKKTKKVMVSKAYRALIYLGHLTTLVVLQIYSRNYYGWSYVLAWLGVALTLSSSFMFLCGAQCLRKEKQKEKNHGTAYLVPIYAGPYHCPYSY